MKSAMIAAALLCSLGEFSPAWASCPPKMPSPHYFRLELKATDEVRPTALQVAAVEIVRGRSSRTGNKYAFSSDFCAGITFLILPAEDDQSSMEEIGYQLIARGDLPHGLEIPDYPVLALRRPREADDGSLLYLLPFTWMEGRGKRLERFDFTVYIRSVDLAGNTGPWTGEIRVQHDGTLAD